MKNLVTLLTCILLCTKFAGAQTISIDAAAVRNQTQKLTGTNLSIFYHFTEDLTAGVELNRFFQQSKLKEVSNSLVSAWDYDLNIHYYLHLHQNWIVYPLAGISFSFEKERTNEEETVNRHFFINSGAGLMLNKKIVKPHIEYTFANGKRKEHLLVAGITIELEL